MTIGIATLAVVAVLLFFGAAERFFDRAGLTSWLAFLLTLALIVGAVLPDITSAALIITPGGSIMPLVVSGVLVAVAVRKGEGARTLLAAIVVTMSTVAFRLIIGTESPAALLACTLTVGFAGGTLAFIAARSSLGALAGAMVGCVLGDIAAASLAYGAFGAETLVLGGYGIFDSIAIACTFGCVLVEVTDALQRAAENKRTRTAALSAEAGEDVDIDADEPEEKKKDPPAEERDETDTWTSDDKNHD